MTSEPMTAVGNTAMIDHRGTEVARLLPAAIVETGLAHPTRPAVTSGTSTLTYGQLIRNASALASRLRAAGVRREATVASLLPRGLALAPALLGTWLAGGGYVPLDPASPPGRRDYMLRDSSAGTVIATEQTARAVSGAGVRIVLVDESGAPAGPPDGTAPAQEPGPAPGQVPSTAAADLAYVIYTSGSTGRPKGVLVEHGGLAALARSHEALLYSGQGREVQQVALNNEVLADSFFSDVAHLGYGRTLHVVDAATRQDPERLAAFLAGHGIEVLDATPTQIQTLVLGGNVAALDSLTVLTIGGEATPPRLWQRLRELTHVHCYNLYGPTEATVDVTAAALRDHVSPSLGTPIPGCYVWVAGETLEPVPDGETGELLIAGAQVARGYLNAAAADVARFVTVEEPGSGQVMRAYRTGDRGRRDAAGNLEYLGRADSQVSIAGYRVEVGEVEAVLRGCPGVRAAAAGTLGDGDQTVLAAYAVVDDGVSIGDLRTRLAADLPPHMMPRITLTDRIPMGATGKADLTGLMPGARPDAETPAGTTTAAVRKIWCDVLEIAGVEDDDDFFTLGGNSVKATSAIVEVRGGLAAGLPIRTLFEQPVFTDFCRAVSAYKASTENDK